MPLSTIEDDFYVFDEGRRNLVGRRTRRVIKLGDTLTVQVAKVDSVKKQVDFCLAVEKRAEKVARVYDPRPQSNRTQAGQRSNSSRQFPARPQSSHPDQKRQQPSHWKNSRPQESRSANPQREESRPAAASKPAMFQTSGAKFSTAPRPLIKSSGANRFQKRRR